MHNEQNDYLMEDNPFDLDFSDSKEEEWAELVAQIGMGNVIPVIGPELLLEEKTGQRYHQYLIDELAKWAGVTSSPGSFSQLLYDRNFQAKLALKRADNDGIYKLLDMLVSRSSAVLHPAVRRLLETRRFPFVITTSFTPVVEQAMRDIWKDYTLRVRSFNNDPRRSEDLDLGDIADESELSIPTVFYMFGKVTGLAHRYVVTDTDMMEFCRSWMSGSSAPRRISESIRKRYLLFLGGNYSDWLFRFIWFSMRRSEMARRKASLVVVPKRETDDREDSFPAFLDRLQTFTLTDPVTVIEQIEKRLAQLDCECGAGDVDDCDVFISYSRRDIELASRLCRKLEARGIGVWFDRHSIREGERWKESIEKGIKKAELFVPLLTPAIAEEFMEEHEYRDEWRIAVERLNRMGGRAFIVPVTTSGFDLYDARTRIPKEFKDLHAFVLPEDADMAEVAGKIKAELDHINALRNGK